MDTRQRQAHCALQALDLIRRLDDHLYRRNEDAFYHMMLDEMEAQQFGIDTLSDGDDDDMWDEYAKEYLESPGTRSEQEAKR